MGLNIFKKKETKEEKTKRTIIEVLKYVGPVVVAILLFIFIKFGIMNRDYTMESISVNKYTSLVSGNKEVLVYFSTTKCDTCKESEELFKRVLKGSNIRIYELKVNELSDADKEKMMGVLTITNNEIQAPLLILVKNKEVISSFNVPVDEDMFINYLQTNNLIK